MIDWICGAICGSVATLLLYSILVEKRIQEKQDEVWRYIFECKEYRHEIRTLKRQKQELEKKLESSDYSDFYEVK